MPHRDPTSLHHAQVFSQRQEPYNVRSLPTREQLLFVTPEDFRAYLEHLDSAKLQQLREEQVREVKGCGECEQGVKECGGHTCST